MNTGPVWLNGRVVDPAEATVSVFDHGLTVGDGVFETMRTVRREPFAISRHLRRLRASAAGLGLAIDRGRRRAPSSRGRDDRCPPGRRAPRPAHGHRRARPGRLGPRRCPAHHADRRRAARLGGADDDGRVGRVDAQRAGSRRRPEDDQLRRERRSRSRRRRNSGATEALFANTAGELCEGTGSNVFVVVDGEILTPPLSSGCLAGITRELLLEVVDVTERPLPIDVLERADEMFLTSSTRDVQAVSHVDGRQIGDGEPGRATTDEPRAASPSSRRGRPIPDQAVRR